jgi:hypothetical protein
MSSSAHEELIVIHRGLVGDGAIVGPEMGAEKGKTGDISESHFQI